MDVCSFHLAIPTTTLAAAAAVGYLAGRRCRSVGGGVVSQLRGEIWHAPTAARESEQVGRRHRENLDQVLASQFALWSRYQSPFSLAVFDIDYLQQISDEQGHFQRDEILKRVAGLLGETIRQTDHFSRHGGEGFVIVMPQTSLEDAAALAERVRRRIEDESRATVSGGIAEMLDGDDEKSLPARAAAALAAAQHAGRNRVYRHTGTEVEPILEEGGVTVAEGGARR